MSINESNCRTAVVYFSAQGHTKRKAEEISKTIDCDIYEINPVVSYSKEDLNWHLENSRTSIEAGDKSCRPAIETIGDFSSYDTIYLGFPIWWYYEPAVIDTFAESLDSFFGDIILFATSGGSGFGDTRKRIQSLVHDGISVFEGTVN